MKSTTAGRRYAKALFSLARETSTINEVRDELGQLVELYQRATVYTGMLYGINPLDQPSVEKGKKLAIQYLQRGSA